MRLVTTNKRIKKKEKKKTYRLIQHTNQISEKVNTFSECTSGVHNCNPGSY